MSRVEREQPRPKETLAINTLKLWSEVTAEWDICEFIHYRALKHAPTGANIIFIVSQLSSRTRTVRSSHYIMLLTNNQSAQNYK